MNEKTIRIDQEQEPVIQAAPGSLDVTLMGNFEPDNERTFVPSGKPSQETGGLVGMESVGVIPAASSVYAINGEIYRVVKSLASNSGEADVFLVESGDERYVLKIYFSNSKPKEELINIVSNMHFELIVKVVDYGVMSINGHDHFFELMEYLEGGNLLDFKLNKNEVIFKRIALSGAAALAYCHANRIIHKDIKPGNFFFRDKERTQLVLGDFGISSVYGEEADLHRTNQARTPIYAAPEMYVDVIDGEVEITPGADYYSLGITLLYLWLGRNPFTKNERVMMRMKSEGRLPELESAPEFVRRIIRGLTGPNPEKRWTYDEVERWYKGENVPIDESSYYLHYKAFIVDPDKNIVAHDVKELAPLLNENRDLGIRYLYSKRISRWLEECGNAKLTLEIDDIIEHRYPTDQEAGLTAAIYAMDEFFPYYGINGEACHSVQEVSLQVMKYADVYAERLKDPSDSLYLYLESREKINRSSLSQYFLKYNKELAIARFVFEIDDTLPFLQNLPSSTPEEITASFGTGKCTEDQWESLVDGRLLSWMRNRQGKIMREAVRLLTEGKSFSMSLAYSVLYTIDRQCAFDLKNAYNPEDVANLLNQCLLDNQNSDNVTFQTNLNDYISLTGRLHFYSTLHGWTSVLDKQEQILNLTSRENTERLGVYDIKIATYKFCAALGVFPSYVFSINGLTNEINSLDELERLESKYIRQEMRQGSLKAWLTLFFHEDPNNTFEEELSYETTLRNYLEFIGKYDPSDNYYKRFVTAGVETQNTMEVTRNSWNKAARLERRLRSAMLGTAALQILLLLFFGIPKIDVFVDYIWFAVWIPLALGSMIVGGIKGYFTANGVTIILMGILAGLASSVVPVYILSYLYLLSPILVVIGCMALTAGYAALGLMWGHRSSTQRLVDLKAAFTQDVNTQLIEPLIYTFKSHTLKYKSSKFNLMEDIAMEVSSAEGELTLHYTSWIIFFAIFIVTFVLYHPSLMDRWLPNTDDWINMLHDWIEQVKDVR